jgi:hypothetical protein
VLRRLNIVSLPPHPGLLSRGGEGARKLMEKDAGAFEVFVIAFQARIIESRDV